MTPRVPVAVIIVSFNTRDLLLDCLASLEAEEVEEIFVVDNASADGSADAVADRFPDVTLIGNPMNVGFAAAVNQAAPLIQSRATLLINSDTSWATGSLDRLVRALEAAPHIGAVAPAIQGGKGRGLVLSVGRDPTIWRMFTHLSGLSRLSRGRPWLQGWQLRIGIDDSAPADVDWASGAFLLLRTVAFGQAGYLSERWFMYAEDLALCRELRRLGWRIVHIPEVRVAHQVGASWEAIGVANTAWLTSLRDFYVQEWHAGVIRKRLWQLVTSAGFMGRSLALVTADVMGHGRGLRSSALEHRCYARAVWREPVPGVGSR